MVEVKVEPGTELPVEVQLLVEGVDTLTEQDIISYILGAGIHPDNFEVTSAEISQNDDTVIEKVEEEYPEGRRTFLSKLKRLLNSAAARNRERGYADLEGLVFLCPKDNQTKSSFSSKPSYKYKKLFLKHYQLGQKLQRQQELNKQAVEELKRKIKVLKDKQRMQVETEVKKTLNTVLTENQSKYLIHGDQNISWKKEDFINSLALKSLAPQCYYFVQKMMHFPLPDDAITNKWLSKQDDEKKSQLLESCTRVLKKFNNKILREEGLQHTSVGEVIQSLHRLIMGVPSNGKSIGSASASTNKRFEPTSNVPGSVKPARRIIKKKVINSKEADENASSSEIEGIDVIRIDETFTINDEEDDDPEWFPPPIERKRKPEEDSSFYSASTSNAPLSSPMEPPNKKSKPDGTVAGSVELIANIQKNLENLFKSDSVSIEKKRMEQVKAPLLKTPLVKTPLLKTPLLKTPLVKTPLVKAPSVKTPTLKPPIVKPNSGNKLNDALKVLEMLSEHVEPSAESPESDVKAKRIVKPTQRLLESTSLSGKFFSTSGMKVPRQFAKKSTRPTLDAIQKSKSPDKSTAAVDSKPTGSSTNQPSKPESGESMDVDTPSTNQVKEVDVASKSVDKSVESLDIEKQLSELDGSASQMDETVSPMDTSSEKPVDKTPEPNSSVSEAPGVQTPKLETSKPNDSVKQVLLMRTRRTVRKVIQKSSLDTCPKSEFLSKLSMVQTLKN